jgi:haloalkane dehalogenase
MVRNTKRFSNLAVLRLNLFVRGAIYMATHKRLSRDVRVGLKAPYNCPAHRIAVLKFVQDIPTVDTDPSYAPVKLVEENLNLFSNIPLLICWGMRDFVFDADYLNEFKRRFPHSEIHTFSNAGHYVLEDVPDEILFHVKRFLKRHPVS